MNLRMVSIWKAVIAICLVGASNGILFGQDAEPKQDPELLRFVERAVPWFPDSTFHMIKEEVQITPSGSYRMVWVERTCDNKFLTGVVKVVIDQATTIAWLGSIGELPIERIKDDSWDLRQFLDDFLPSALARILNRKVRLDWDSETDRSGGLIPFFMRVDTGYGEYLKPAAVTSDGRYFVLGSSLPYDRDPVAFRRELLRASSDVAWDRSVEEARVDIVEFSDFECPGCKRKWPLIKQVMESHPGSVRHGFVAFPLTAIHPWAFRSASASWCVAQHDPELVIPLKETFYSLQREMEVSEVTPTALDFVAAHDMDEGDFLACYLRKPSLDGVHAMLALGNSFGVNATPTYYVNGWMVQAPEEVWLAAMVDRLLSATGG